MFVRYKTQGIIVKKDDWKEADRFFTVYTKDFGKIKILGRGIRKISSKLKSGMETFYFSEIEFIQGETYKTLVDAILIDKFEKLRIDLKKTVIAYRILGIFDDLIQGQEKDEKVWNLLLGSLRDLNDQENYKIVYYRFFWNLLSLLGYTPNLYCCSICQNKLEYKKNYFDLEEGGIICSDCFDKKKKGREINPDLIKILRVLLQDKKLAFNLKINQDQVSLLKELSQDYLSSFINKHE